MSNAKTDDGHDSLSSESMGKTIRKEWPRVRTELVHGKIKWTVDARSKSYGKGGLERYPSRDTALTRARKLADMRAGECEEGMRLDLETRAAAVKGKEVLEPLGSNVGEAVEAHAATLKARQAIESSVTVEVSIGKWLDEKWAEVKAGRAKEITVKGYASNSRPVIKAIGDISMSQLMARDLAPLFAQPVAENTHRLRWVVLNGAMQVAEREGWMDRPLKRPRKFRGINTAGEATCPSVEFGRRLLEAGRSHVDAYTAMPVILLEGWLGMRPDEARRQRWEDWQGDHWYVRPETSKIADARYIPVSPEFAAAMAPYRREGGPVAGDSPGRLRAVLGQIRALAGLRMSAWQVGLDPDHEPTGALAKLPWTWETTKSKAGEQIAVLNPAGNPYTEDLLRHGFGSAHLAQGQNIYQTAEVMGTSPAMIKRHYRRAMPQERGEAWFALLSDLA